MKCLENAGLVKETAKHWNRTAANDFVHTWYANTMQTSAKHKKKE